MRTLSVLTILGSGLALGLGVGACNKKAEGPAAPASPPSAPAAQAPAAPAPGPGDPGAPPDVKAPPADAVKTASGLASKVLKPGTGTAKAEIDDWVKVHYTGWTTDGRKFDSSAGGEPARFQLTSMMIKGWNEGMQLMVEGEKRRFWIPADLAYGDKPAQPGAPAGMLVFDVEVLGVTKPPRPPADVAAPPKNATKTKSGLAYRVLEKGTSKERPTADSEVEVHYTGWTTDGKMFDSSVARDQTATFPLKGVIAGWTEGVQLMSVGEKTRFWIPSNLAYGDNGRVPGMLVFDIQLLAIKKTQSPGAHP